MLLQHAAHPLDGPGQVDSGRPRRLERLRHDGEPRARALAGGALEAQYHAHRGGHADRRRAADHHRTNRAGHGAVIPVNAIDLAARQQPLIEHAHAARPPLHRVDCHCEIIPSLRRRTAALTVYAAAHPQGQTKPDEHRTVQTGPLLSKPSARCRLWVPPNRHRPVRSRCKLARSYKPRALRLTIPASIQRVTAAKISEGRLSLSPRTPRTSEALNCLGNCSSTARQLIRPPALGAPSARAPRPAADTLPVTTPSLDSSSLRRASSASLTRISLRNVASSARACC